MSNLFIFYVQIILIYYVITFAPATIKQLIGSLKNGKDYTLIFRDYLVFISLLILLIIGVPEFLL